MVAPSLWYPVVPTIDPLASLAGSARICCSTFLNQVRSDLLRSFPFYLCPYTSPSDPVCFVDEQATHSNEHRIGDIRLCAIALSSGEHTFRRRPRLTCVGADLLVLEKRDALNPDHWRTVLLKEDDLPFYRPSPARELAASMSSSIPRKCEWRRQSPLGRCAPWCLSEDRSFVVPLSTPRRDTLRACGCALERSQRQCTAWLVRAESRFTAVVSVPRAIAPAGLNCLPCSFTSLRTGVMRSALGK